MTVGRLPNVEGGIQPTLLTTTGDIMYASSANNPARLGIGSSAQVLTVAAGIPSWATPASGSITLLTTTSLSGSETLITSIDQTYEDLRIYVYGVTNATANGVFFANPRNSTTNLDVSATAFTGNPANAGSYDNDAGPRLCSDVSQITSDRTSAVNFWALTIKNYASTSQFKTYEVAGGFYNSATAVQTGWNVIGHIYSTSAVNAMRFANSGGNLSTGTVEIYGVK